MKLALYGILIVLALFIVLMVFNPNLSCFGRKLRSPLYPILRKKKQKQKRMKTVDYGFDLVNPGEKRIQKASSQKQAQLRKPATRHNIATEDYGFDLGGGRKEEKP